MTIRHPFVWRKTKITAGSMICLHFSASWRAGAVTDKLPRASSTRFLIAVRLLRRGWSQSRLRRIVASEAMSSPADRNARALDAADIERRRTPRMKFAAGRATKEARNVADDFDSVTACVGVRLRVGREQSRRVAMPRPRKDSGRRPFFHDAP